MNNYGSELPPPALFNFWNGAETMTGHETNRPVHVKFRRDMARTPMGLRSRSLPRFKTRVKAACRLVDPDHWAWDIEFADAIVFRDEADFALFKRAGWGDLGDWVESVMTATDEATLRFWRKRWRACAQR